MRIVLTDQKNIPYLIGGAVLGLLIFVLALTLLMLPYSRQIDESGGADLTCLQIPFTENKAQEIVASYGPEARAAARQLHLPGDLIFPVSYGLLYASLLALIVRKQEGSLLRLGMIAILFPLIAMIFDWLENLFILRMLVVYADPIRSAPLLPLIGGIAGSIKYLFLSILTPLYGLAGIVALIVHRRIGGISQILLYGVILSLLLFNPYQLITSVLPCIIY